MISRSQLPSLLVGSAAVLAAAAVFVGVGGLAGMLYAAAALTLGLILHRRLAGEPEPVAPVSAAQSADAPRRRRLQVRLPRGRRAVLEAELARAADELAARELASAELKQQLEEQYQRLRELQSSFAERITQLTGELEAGKSALAGAQTTLAARDQLIAELTRERNDRRAQAESLAAQLSQLRAEHGAERDKLAWSWRAHVEELTALETALEAVVRAS